MPDLQQLAGEVIESVKRLVERSSAALIKRIEALETREVRDGKDGANGIDGKDGAQGPAGERGEKGEHGERGETGPQGEKGEAGQPGPQGEKGAVGAQGDQGAQGEKGMPGAAGERGTDGRNGVDGLAIRPEIGIDSTRSYREGIWCAYKGGLVRAMRDTDPLGDGSLKAAGWEVMVDGVAAIEVAQSSERQFAVHAMRTSGEVVNETFTLPVMIHRGVFKEGEDYRKGDVVTWGGSMWHCEVEATKAKPDSGDGDWKLVVKRGRDGKDK